jgi:hypothetical protein
VIAKLLSLKTSYFVVDLLIMWLSQYLLLVFIGITVLMALFCYWYNKVVDNARCVG